MTLRRYSPKRAALNRLVQPVRDALVLTACAGEKKITGRRRCSAGIPKPEQPDWRSPMSSRDSISAPAEKLEVEALDVPEFPGYRAASDGSILSKRRKPKWTALVPRPNNAGYLMVALHRGTERFMLCVHRIVAATFHEPCPEGHEVNHKDGVRFNNAPSNLEYVTRSQNIRHAMRTTGAYSRRRRGNSLTVKDVREIRATPRIIGAVKSLAKRYGVSQETIRRIFDRRTYVNVE